MKDSWSVGMTREQSDSEKRSSTIVLLINIYITHSTDYFPEWRKQKEAGLIKQGLTLHSRMNVTVYTKMIYYHVNEWL